jgi:hypothetical protein
MEGLGTRQEQKIGGQNRGSRTPYDGNFVSKNKNFSNCLKQRTAMANQIRSLPGEYVYVISKGIG